MNLTAQAVIPKIIIGIATAGALWATSTLVEGKTTNALQDAQLERHEKTLLKIDSLSEQLTETNKNLAVFQEQLKEVRNESRK